MMHLIMSMGTLTRSPPPGLRCLDPVSSHTHVIFPSFSLSILTLDTHTFSFSGPGEWSCPTTGLQYFAASSVSHY